jgi:hypothetical protein
MPKQVDKYVEERKQVLSQMLEILGITEQNNMFSLHKLDGDEEKQAQILALENDIKKYFLCGEWTCFKKKDTVKRRWLSMIKYVVKDMGYQINGSNIVSKTDDYNMNGTIYFITGKNS